MGFMSITEIELSKFMCSQDKTLTLLKSLDIIKETEVFYRRYG
jgi:hypothetical protein